MPDISQITPWLWVGSAPDTLRRHRAASYVRRVAASGITLVIDCRAGADDRRLWQREPAVRYLNFGIVDSGEAPPDEWFDGAVEAVSEHRAQGSGDVLVHCAVGASRSPSLAFALLLVDGMEPEAAAELVRSRRPGSLVTYREPALRWFARYRGEGP